MNFHLTVSLKCFFFCTNKYLGLFQGKSYPSMKSGSHKCFLIFLTIMIPMIITSSKSIDWNINGQVQWARRCRFQGDHNIGQSFSTEEECGMVCLTITRCTHFVWLSDICFLKRIQGNHNIKLESTDVPNSRCGSIIDRVPY